MKNAIKKFFKENYKLMIITFLIGMLAHGFAVTNKLIAYDEMNHIFAKGVSLPSARWGLELVSYIFPNVSMPWYNGLFAIAILSISFALVIDILGIKNKYFKILICGVLITFPAIANTFAFMYAVTAYSTSIFFSVLSVALLRSKNKIFNILAIITIILSLSIYQSYVCITMVMLIILLMKDCIDKKKDVKDIIRSAIKYLVLIIISLVGYLVITKVINYALNITYSHYKGLDSMGVFTIKDIINGILISYKNIYDLFPKWSLGDTFGFNSFIKIFIFIVLLFTVVLTIIKFIQLIRKKEITRAILLLVLLIIQPIAINFIIVINPKIDDVYSVMIYQYVFLVIEPIILYEFFNYKNKKIKAILYTVFIIIIFQFVTIANEFHFSLYLGYENTYSFTSGLVNRIFKTEGYNKSTPIAFMGRYNGELNTQYYDYFKEVSLMGASYVDNETIYPDMRYKFIKYFMGIDFKNMYFDDTSDDIEFVNASKKARNKINDIRKTIEFKEMNNYPYNNSIRNIDGIIVVKFSEETILK